MSQKTLSLSEVPAFCQELSQQLQKKQIVLLEGPLGAGKTELVKEFVKALGGLESSSPTYALINEYVLKQKTAYHVDLYRIDGEEDLESVGFWDLFEGDEGLIFIEWASRLEISQLPLSWSKLKVKVSKPDDNHCRIYEIEEL